MALKVIYSKRALKVIAKMPRKDGFALSDKIDLYAERPIDSHPWAKPLVGTDKIRISHGQWRAICLVDNPAFVLEIERVGHRKSVYR
jgi:mRNA-degrading endonuclease RelE of RelBE toxin-antitoxin system